MALHRSLVDRSGFMELIIQCSKETAVRNVNTTVEQEAKSEPVELLDCGEASKVTKGWLYSVITELAWPPFDHAIWG